MAERARAAAPDAEVLVGDASVLDLPDGSFDVVLSGFVVFFMPDPTAALREWGRVLRPDGRLCMSTWGQPDPRWEFERELRRSYVSQFEPALLQELGAGLQLLNRFDSREKVAAELEAAGFGELAFAEHQVEFVFADEQAWWEFNWSHGSRMVLEPMSEEARASFRAEMRKAMEQVRDERGFPRTYTALFASARRAV
jgi:SAM-dependent methyltransferase